MTENQKILGRNQIVKRILGVHDPTAAQHIEQLIFYCFCKVRESKLTLEDFKSICQHCEELLELIQTRIKELKAKGKSA